MDLFDKLKILSDAAKYDVACTSSGVDRKAQKGQIGSAVSCGICHSFAGDGRWRASGILGLSTVPAIIREASDKDVLELALIENLQRENLSPLEEAAGYMRLKTEFRMKQGDIAKRVGKSRAAVANSMRLLDLPQPVQDMLGNTFISVGHAKVLLSLKNKDQQIQLGRDIVNKGYTVRQTEKAIQKMLNQIGRAHV